MKGALHGIRGVTFDVGGTLIRPWPSVGHVYSDVASSFGITGIAPEALNHGFDRAWRSRSAFDYSRAAWRRLVEESFAKLSPQAPSEACFEAIYRRFERADAWRLFDDVTPVLKTLTARGLKLGIISNWDERLRPLLGALQMTQHFDVLTISCEAGCAKPAPGIFRACAAQLGFSPEAILHVGDSGREDVAGAKAAGMQALLLDRRAEGEKPGAVSGLGEVSSLLGKAFFPSRPD